MAKNSAWQDLPLVLDWQLARPNSEIRSLKYSGSGQATADYLDIGARPISRLINLLPVKYGDKASLRVREFIANAGTAFSKGTTVTTPRGIWWLPTLRYLVEFWDTTLYSASAADTYTTTGSMGAATQGEGGVCEGVNSSGAKYAFFASASKSVIISNTNTHTQVTDADYPSTVIPMPVFMDSYVFVAAGGTRKIYNCNVGDPTSWQASTYIETEESGGFIVGLARQKKMVVALCEDHIEFFRDAGIPSPNSPLQRQPEYASQIGCVNRSTITQCGDVIYFAGIDKAGTIGMYKIENFTVEKISNDSIDFAMRLYAGSNGVTGYITTWNNTTSSSTLNFMTTYMTSMYGKPYLVVCTNAGVAQNVSNTSLTPFVSWVYDPEFKIWIEIANMVSLAAVTPTSCVGGWSFPYGTIVNQPSGTWPAVNTLFQLALGGTDDNNLATFDGSTLTGDAVSLDGGFTNPSLAAHNTIIGISWDMQDFGISGLKDLDGVWVDMSGENALPFRDSNNFTAAFKRYANYPTDSGTQYSLKFTDAYSTAAAEMTGAVYFMRRAMGSFYSNAFRFQAPIVNGQTIRSVRVRITPHGEL